jgi:acyl-CoA thioesterase II
VPAAVPTDLLGLAPDAAGRPRRPAPTVDSLADVLAVLDLAGDVTPPVPVRSLPNPAGIVLGAQQLAQQVVLAERLAPGKSVQTLHTVFPNPSRLDRPVDVDVEWLQSARTFANLTLTFRQHGVAVSRCDVLLGADGADFVRHEPARPEPWAGPDGAAPAVHPMMPWEVRTAAGPEPFSLDLWQRVPDAPDDPTLARALAAYASEPLLVPLVLRAHAARGAGTVGPGERLAASILAETVTFVEQLDARDWHLIRLTAPHAGRGRVLGRGELFRADGRLCGVFECLAVLRALPARPPATG